MAMKKIDFKQLMLEKGEKIGMGVALFFMLILVLVGAVSGINADKPADIADDIRDKASKIESKLASGPPVSDPKINQNLMKPLGKDLVALAPYRNGADNFTETTLEDKKRRNPQVVMPVQSEVEVIHAAVKVPIAYPQRDHLRVGILKPKVEPKEGDRPKLPPQVQQVLKANQGNKAAVKQFVKMYGRQIPGLVDEYKRMFGLDADKDKYTLELVDASKLDDIKDVQLATTVKPQRMVIVTAAFPYLSQVDAYHFALKEPVEKLSASNEMPKFLPFNVQRRTLDANGKVKEPWAPLDLVGNYNAVFLYNRLIGSEEEDASLPKVLFKHGLVMARPKLVRGEYNPVRLDKIKEAVELLSKGTNVLKVAPSPLQQQINPFDAFGQAETSGGEKNARPAEPGAVDSEKKEKEEAVPKYCLIRFIDTDEKLKPGMTYEYRMQIKVANPNYGKDPKDLAYPSLKDDKELVSAWWPKEDSKEVIRAKIEPEFYYYGTELDDRAEKVKKDRDPRLYVDARDVTFLQAHRWLEKARLNPDNAATQVPVGDWSVCDIPIRRGEYIARIEPVDLPIWSPQALAFRLAVPQAPPKAVGLMRQPKASTGIPVNFAPFGSDPDLLVDFEGGRVQQSFRPSEKGRTISIREDSAVEYLILRADGSLIVRNSRQDAKNPVREETYNRWKKLVDQTRGGKPGGGGPGGGNNNPFN